MLRCHDPVISVFGASGDTAAILSALDIELERYTAEIANCEGLLER